MMKPGKLRMGNYRHANYYVKVAEKVLDKAGFAQKEFDRLTRILTGALSIEKRDGVMLRKNVLGKFLGMAQEKMAPEETVKEEL